MADHMEEQPPQKRVKLQNAGFQGSSDSSGKCTHFSWVPTS